MSERVTAGLARARKEGRKVVVSINKIRKLADQGLSAVEIGVQLGCSRDLLRQMQFIDSLITLAA